MKFKFGDEVQVVKGKFHKGANGVVVGFFKEKETGKKRYIVSLDHDVSIHANHAWLEKTGAKDELLK